MKNEMICQTGTVTELPDNEETVVDTKNDMNDIDECISGLLDTKGGSLPSLTNITGDLGTPSSLGTQMNVDTDLNLTNLSVLPVPTV